MPPSYESKLKPIAAPSYASKLRPLAAAPTPQGPTAMSRITGAANAVTDFIGARGIADQFGASLAGALAPKKDRPFIQGPGLKNVLGSAIQTGAMLIPGAGVAANTAKKVGLGLATGYGIDVGSKLQSEKPVVEAVRPGLATAIGGILPILGRITGLSDVGKATQQAASKLEELNMRLTPVEKQNLVKQGKNIADYLARKQIVGSPAQRYAKVDALYDDMERQVTRVVDSSTITFPKHSIIQQLKQIPDRYRDNLSEYNGVLEKVDRIAKTLDSLHGDSISASALNKIKRAEWKNAFNKQGSDVINEVSDEVARVLMEALNASVNGLQKINQEYGTVIAARKALFKATSRNQSGLLGKAAGLVAGTGLGGAVAGPGGAAVGAFVGPQAVNAVATPTRSVIGAGLQGLSNLISKTPAASRGFSQIPRKALFQALPQE